MSFIGSNTMVQKHNIIRIVVVAITALVICQVYTLVYCSDAFLKPCGIVHLLLIS